MKNTQSLEGPDITKPFQGQMGGNAGRCPT